MANCEIFYHVTTLPNAAPIKTQGLKPAIGPRSRHLGETTPAIYLFGTREELDDAVLNWLGEQFDGGSELIFPQLCVPRVISSQFQRDAFEYRSFRPLPGKYIYEWFDEHWQPLFLQNENPAASSMLGT